MTRSNRKSSSQQNEYFKLRISALKRTRQGLYVNLWCQHRSTWFKHSSSKFNQCDCLYNMTYFAEVALSEDDATTTVLPTNGSASHLGDPFHDDASEDSIDSLDGRDVHDSDQMDPNGRIAC